ncbi:3724_t:CDS:2, partial [Dentiscutata erythropus]
RNDKFVTGSALYRVTDDEDEFRKITYKGFTSNSKSLIANFEKNSIICLVQTVPISSSNNDFTLTPEDLPYTFPLLLYSAPAVTNSYKSNDNIGRQSFIQFKLSPQSKIPHIISSEIEWSYTSNEAQSSTLSQNEKLKVCKDFNSQLNLIEEQYTAANSQASNKRKKFPSFSFTSNSSSNKSPTVDLTTLVLQIRSNESMSQPSS